MMGTALFFAVWLVVGWASARYVLSKALDGDAADAGSVFWGLVMTLVAPVGLITAFIVFIVWLDVDASKAARRIWGLR